MRLKIKVRKLNKESKRTECEKNNGWACYMHPEKDPSPSKKTVIEPVNLKKENKMIKLPSSKEILAKNEKELENIMASYKTSDALRSIIIDELGELESEPAAFEALFSKPGAVQRFMERCLDRFS